MLFVLFLYHTANVPRFPRYAQKLYELSTPVYPHCPPCYPHIALFSVFGMCISSLLVCFTVDTHIFYAFYEQIVTGTCTIQGDGFCVFSCNFVSALLHFQSYPSWYGFCLIFSENKKLPAFPGKCSIASGNTVFIFRVFLPPHRGR